MRVVFYAPTYRMWVPFNPANILDKMIGGGETYLMMGAKALGEAGHRVKVYVPQGSGVFGNVSYHDTSERITDCDVLVCCETDNNTGHVESDYRMIACQCNDPSIFHRVDYCLVPSVWLGKYINEHYRVKLNKMVVIPDATFSELYDRNDIDKVRGRLIYASSPDRGLHHLLRIFPKIKKKVTEAHLRIFYAFWPQFEANKYGMDITSEIYWKIRRSMNQEGVEYVGPVGKRQLAEEELSSELLVYPEDTIRPTEGFGITYADMLAARVAIVAPDVDAVGEVWGDYIALMPPPPHNDKDWVDITVELLRDESLRRKYYEAGREKVFQDYTWAAVGEKWVKLLERIKEERDVDNAIEPALAVK